MGLSFIDSGREGFMNRFGKTIQARLIRSAAAAFIVVCGSSASAFELLSEGAMDSVSAVSAESVEEILNVAGSTAAGLSDDYEILPFQTRISVAEGDVDEVQTELNFELTQEVEAWAEELRQQGQDQLDIGYVEQLPPTTLDIDPFVLRNDGPTTFVLEGSGDDDTEQTIFQQGRISQTFELLNSGVDTITYRVERYVERAATINANPGNDNSSIGSGFVSEARSFSTNTLTAIRD